MAGDAGTDLSARFPSRPVALSWAATEAGGEVVLSGLLAPPFALAHSLSQQTRRQGLLTVVNWLEAQPGGTWQDRWIASGAQDEPDWRRLVTRWRADRTGTGGDN